MALCEEIIMIMMMDNTEERVVMPAPGASLKGVRAYLSRWGLAQPRPRTLH